MFQACLLQCVTTITASYTCVLKRKWYLPEGMIRVSGYINFTLFVSSIWIIVLSAIERHVKTHDFFPGQTYK